MQGTESTFTLGRETTSYRGGSRRKTSAPQPVFRLLVIAFALIALIPLCIVAYEINRSAWNDAWREVREKHQLLAENLASPIDVFIQDQHDVLSYLANELSSAGASRRALGETQRHLEKALFNLRGFRSLTLVDVDGAVTAHSNFAGRPGPPADALASTALLRQALTTEQWALSTVQASMVDGEPSVLMAEPIFDERGTLEGALIGELRLDLLEKLRSSIAFGEGGHSAIVDSSGRILAHPNPAWRLAMKDLSHLLIVQRMLEGETGVTEFHSPFVKQDMVAGFASVPGIGWGIMVPQPKAEIEAQVRQFLYTHLAWSLLALVAAIGLAIPIARWITRPINRLAAVAEGLTDDPSDRQIPPVPRTAPAEVQQLGGALKGLVSSLQQSRGELRDLNESLKSRVDESTKQLRQANEQLVELARSDHLTSLANRRYFEQVLSNAIERSTEQGAVHALLYLDLDGFKIVNDTCGHLAGDALLQQVSGVLARHVREQDTAARFGGDEFAVLLEDSSQEKALALANRLRMAVRAISFSTERHRFEITTSIGLVMITSEFESIADVLRAADTSCFDAKSRGKDQVQTYDSGHGAKSPRVGNTPWTTRIAEALENDRFHLYKQPIQPISSPELPRMCEILLRMESDSGELIPPAAFLPAAERFNLMVDIDLWVVRCVLDAMASTESWASEETVLVNLSPRSLTDCRIIELVTDRLRSDATVRDRICFEVSESVGIENIKQANDIMSGLKTLGCRFALDDFGTGMSSFAYLQGLPLDILKIDGSFVNRMGKSAADYAIVKAVNEIGHAMGMFTVAESVSESGMLEALREIDVDYAQGFAVEAPFPVRVVGVLCRSET